MCACQMYEKLMPGRVPKPTITDSNGNCVLQTLPLFLDRITDPVTTVIVSVTVVLIFGE